MCARVYHLLQLLHSPSLQTLNPWRQVEEAVAELVEVEGTVGELANDFLAALLQAAGGLEGGAGDGENYGEEGGEEGDEYADDGYGSDEFEAP